jgi:RNA polymerase sigma factor (sigma-70 family)
MATEDTLHHIFMSARKTMTRIVSRIVPPREIEDIVQETYVRICQIEQKENIKQPRSFLFKTARNLAIDHLKKAEVRLVDSTENFTEFELFPAQEDEIYHQVASNEEFAQYCEAIRHLPLQCRKVFVLKKVYGYSQKEIAQQLELSESTVEKHVALGVKRCTYYMMQLARGETQGTMNKSSKSHQQGGSAND